MKKLLLLLSLLLNNSNTLAVENNIDAFCPKDWLEAPIKDYEICESYIEKDLGIDLVGELDTLASEEIFQSIVLRRGLITEIEIYDDGFTDREELIIDLAALGAEEFLLYVWENLELFTSSNPLKQSAYFIRLPKSLSGFNEALVELDQNPEVALKILKEINPEEINLPVIKFKYFITLAVAKEKFNEDISDTLKKIINLYKVTPTPKFSYLRDLHDVFQIAHVSSNVGNGDRYKALVLELIYNFETKNGKVEDLITKAIDSKPIDYSLTALLRLRDYQLSFEAALNPYNLQRIVDDKYELIAQLISIRNMMDDSPMKVVYDAELVSIYSTFAVQLFDLGNCEESIIYFKKSYELYTSLGSDLDFNWNPETFFYEPLFAAICSIKIGAVDESRFFLDASQKELKKAREVKFIHPLKIALFDSVSIQDSLLREDYNGARTKFNKLIKRLSKKETSLPTEITPMKFLNRVININFLNYSKLLTRYSSDELEDPLKVYNLKFLINEDKSIENILLSKKSENLLSIESQFLNQTNKIRQLENNLRNNFKQEIVNELKQIISLRNETQEQIYILNNSIKQLVNPEVETLLSLRLKSSINKSFLIFNSSADNTICLIINNKKINLFEIKLADKEIDSWISEFRDGMINEKETFNFQLAYNIYSNLFSDAFRNIQKDSAIVIYGNELNGLPLSALIKNIPEESSFLENFYQAEWLLFDYSFAYFIPSSLSKNNANYENNFLGYGNPDFKGKLSLPRLISAENEIVSLAMASGGKRKNIYLRDRATKSNLLESLKSSYKRIAIGTHSISEFKDLNLYEPSLVFADRDNPILKASEIANLSIKADVVILSSCNTVIDYRSPSFTTLPRAFLIAGTRSIIFSYWNIETQSAAEVNKSLFQAMWLNEDLGYDEALRIGLINLLNQSSFKSYIHPKYWAGYAVAYSDI